MVLQSLRISNARRIGISIFRKNGLYFFHYLRSCPITFEMLNKFNQEANIHQAMFKKNPANHCRAYSARNRNRTCTSLRTADFESAASTNSAIRACLLKLYEYCLFPYSLKIRGAILHIPSYPSKYVSAISFII